MTLPGFIVIGAAKAGTTTLHRDLRSNPGIFLPEKQPAYLGSDRALTPEGRARFEARFEACGPGQLCGVVSTMCATRPHVDRVPERALDVLGRELKVVYIVREPVDRAVSDHFDLARFGGASLDVDRELLTRPQLLDESRYAMQLAPWLETFGPDNVKVIHFETYVRRRRATIAELSGWLGVEPRPDLVDEAIVENRGEEQAVMPWYGLWPPARKLAGALLPEAFKERLRRVVPRRRARRRLPSPETIQRVRDLLAADTARFHELLGLDEPLWDPAAPGARLLDSALLGPLPPVLPADSTHSEDPVPGVTPEPG